MELLKGGYARMAPKPPVLILVVKGSELRYTQKDYVATIPASLVLFAAHFFVH